MIKNLLLEIGTEELPASYINPACAQLEAAAKQILEQNVLGFSAVRTFCTPRRLTLLIEKVADKTEDRVQEFMGPSVLVGKDAAGNYTPAAKGFAAKHNFPAQKLVCKKTQKGEYLCVVKKIPGEKAEKLFERVLPEMISRISFPKTMRWEPSGFRFARPIRTIIALLDKKVIKFSIAGVTANRVTAGLHTLGGKKITITSTEKYLTVLKNNCIIADPAERKATLKKAIDSAAKRIRCEVVQDEGLFEDVNDLVEHPVAVVGEFDKKFLGLPQEVLTTCLKAKQKAFSICDSKGKLTNYFIGVRNGISQNQDVVRQGYEKVAAARLSDAQFFYNQDIKIPFSSRVEKLKGITFQEKLGSMYDKALRVEGLALFIQGVLKDKDNVFEKITSIEKACQLMKADLTTNMVFEYPELQGVAGRFYSLHDNEDKEVSSAIEEHLWPLQSDERLPASSLGIILSLADKLDTLAGDFAAGLIPSGSNDPYGLKRTAGSILRVLSEKQLTLSLRSVLEKAFSLLPDSVKKNAKAADELTEFFRQRIETLWQQKGYKFDEIRAVLASGSDDVYDFDKRAAALNQIRAQKDFEPLAAAFKRASNILKQADKAKESVPDTPNPELFMEEAERSLYQNVQAIESDIKSLVDAKEYLQVLKKIVVLKGGIDEFFEKVMVMVDDAKIKSNRLALLNYTTKLFSKILDFSFLQG
jgi:glycyl-tRNA synthetase beta chain